MLILLMMLKTLFPKCESRVNNLYSAKIEYALCGGLALAAYGIVRATLDIYILRSSGQDIEDIRGLKELLNLS